MRKVALENWQVIKKNLTIMQGDATDLTAVKNAILRHDAVVSTLGSNTGLGKTTILHEMTQNIVLGMREHQVARIAYTASVGIDNEIPGLVGKLTTKLLRNVKADHRNAVAVIKENNIKWTIARPLGLNDKTKYRDIS
jgi:putative NADH-flavin reductase